MGFNKVDIEHMQTCLSLASRAAGRTSPNPMVGAVLVDEHDDVVSTGYHKAAGSDHAEIDALKKAGKNAKDCTLYVNLEPCHIWGKTGPCVDAIKKAGVKKVIAGMIDPNPDVSGKGLDALRASGIEVDFGVLEDECRWLNKAFIKSKTTGLPWVCLKLASTLDGKIADRHGNSRWISGKVARRYVHKLRDTYDCVMIGGSTAINDDPELNVRDLEDGRDPTRVILDPKLKLKKQAKVCQAPTGGKTIIYCLESSYKKSSNEYPDHVLIIPINSGSNNSNKLNLNQVLQDLGSRSILSVLCEGGGRLAAGLLESNLVDEIQWIVVPKILMDSKAVSSIAGLNPIMLSNSLDLKKVVVRRLDDDFCIQGLLSENIFKKHE